MNKSFKNNITNIFIGNKILVSYDNILIKEVLSHIIELVFVLQIINCF